jgi:Coenzyme PQQ synthesis protein D (PqqD)
MTAMVSQTSNLKAIVSEDGAVILDIERDSMSTLNPTGAYVWQGLQRGDTIETIIANLASETSEDHLIVERDVRGFVAELQQKQLMPR